jgi:hypothetical protein
MWFGVGTRAYLFDSLAPPHEAASTIFSGRITVWCCTAPPPTLQIVPIFNASLLNVFSTHPSWAPRYLLELLMY